MKGRGELLLSVECCESEYEAKLRFDTELLSSDKWKRLFNESDRGRGLVDKLQTLSISLRSLFESTRESSKQKMKRNLFALFVKVIDERKKVKTNVFELNSLMSMGRLLLQW